MVDKLEVLIIGLKNRVDLLVVVVVYISSVVGILVDLLGVDCLLLYSSFGYFEGI